MQADAIANLSGTRAAARDESDRDVKSAIFRTKLDAYTDDLKEFPHVLDRVDVLASTYCPAIDVDGADLA